MNFILWVAVIVLFVQMRSLARRVHEVEDQLFKKTAVPTDSVTATTAQSAYQTTTAPGVLLSTSTIVSEMPVPSFTPSAVTAERVSLMPVAMQQVPVVPAEFFLYTWFKEQTLIKIGAVLFFLGAVWFVSYAIHEGWISETLRIMLGICAGVLLYVAAFWRSKTDTTQYLIITALGTAIIMATIYAGQMLFLVFPPALALCLIVLCLTYTVWVSVKAAAEWLAVIAAVAGLLAPFMINSAAPDLGGLMIYLLSLSVGLLTVVFYTNWRTVSFVLVVGVSLLQVQALGTVSALELWWYGVALALVFLASSTTSLVRSRVPEAIDIATLGIAGLLYTVLANAGASMPGLALFIAAFVFAVIGYSVHVRDAAPPYCSGICLFCECCLDDRNSFII